MPVGGAGPFVTTCLHFMLPRLHNLKNNNNKKRPARRRKGGTELKTHNLQISRRISLLHIGSKSVCPTSNSVPKNRSFIGPKVGSFRDIVHSMNRPSPEAAAQITQCCHLAGDRVEWLVPSPGARSRGGRGGAKCILVLPASSTPRELNSCLQCYPIW